MANDKKQSARFARGSSNAREPQVIVVPPSKEVKEARTASDYQRHIDEANRRANNERSHKY